jgi:plastocyanin
MATLSTAELNSLATKGGTDFAYAALFTADPGLTGTVVGEVSGGSYARVALSFGAASGGVVTATATLNVPAGTTITYAGVCSASTGNTLLGRNSITSQTFATAGQYVMTTTFTVTS